ncbi:MAG: hypothetical protein QOD32_2360 [Pyrinomonadaceae bacterium]|nr:hypothetical protein [Pyrinomonadaceae bacterium]
MRALHVEEARHRRAQAQLFRVGRVDAADHRLRHALQSLAPETSPDKLREAFVIVIAVNTARASATREEEIERHARLTRPTENVRRDERPEARGREQVKAFGHGAQPPTAHDE